jgi:hypothetical protein
MWNVSLFELIFVQNSLLSFNKLKYKAFMFSQKMKQILSPGGGVLAHRLDASIMQKKSM